MRNRDVHCHILSWQRIAESLTDDLLLSSRPIAVGCQKPGDNDGDRYPEIGIAEVIHDSTLAWPRCSLTAVRKLYRIDPLSDSERRSSTRTSPPLLTWCSVPLLYVNGMTEDRIERSIDNDCLSRDSIQHFKASAYIREDDGKNEESFSASGRLASCNQSLIMVRP